MSQLLTGRGASPGRWAAILGAAAIALGGLSACGGDESPGPEAAGGGAPSQIQDEGARQEGTVAGEATISEVLENPSRFSGQQVVVSGAVGQVLVDPGAFTLGASVSEEAGLQEGAGAEGDASAEMLVLPTGGTQVRANEITEGDTVQVTGTICPVTAQIQSEQDNLEFLFEQDAGTGAGAAEAGFLRQFQDQPGVFATQVDATVREEGEGPAPGNVRTTGQQGGSCPGGTGGGTGG